MQVTDKKISKVYEGKVIEGKGQFFNFYLEGGKNKYGYFVGKGKVAPNEGMRIAVMEWEVKQEGQYTNNHVTKLVWMGADQPVISAKNPTGIDKSSPYWFIFSYLKDVEVKLIEKGESEFKTLLEIGLHVASVSLDVLNFIEDPTHRIPKPEPEPEKKDLNTQVEEHDPLGDEIPY